MADEGIFGKLLRGLFGGSTNVDIRWGEQSGATHTRKTVVYQKSVIKIVKDGKTQTVQGSGTDLRELAEQAGLPLEELMTLVGAEHLNVDDSAMSAEAVRPTAPRATLSSLGAALTCAKCQGVTRGQTTCQWCGTELVEPLEAASQTVDDKFLQQDVLPDAASQDQRQKLRQTFNARLRGIEPESDS